MWKNSLENLTPTKEAYEKAKEDYKNKKQSLEDSESEAYVALVRYMKEHSGTWFTSKALASACKIPWQSIATVLTREISRVPNRLNDNTTIRRNDVCFRLSKGYIFEKRVSKVIQKVAFLNETNEILSYGEIYLGKRYEFRIKEI